MDPPIKSEDDSDFGWGNICVFTTILSSSDLIRRPMHRCWTIIRPAWCASAGRERVGMP